MPSRYQAQVGKELQMNTVNTLPVVRSENMIDGCGTYFRTSDVTPRFENGELVVANGVGYKASWGKSQVSSTVKPLAENVVKVEVTGWHKHTVSPVGGSFYFVREGEGWVRRTANHKAVKAVLSN